MTETTWIEGDWHRITKGQLVRMEKGDQWAELSEWADFQSLAHFAADGWNLFVAAPPKPELPTEVGHYIDVNGCYMRVKRNGIGDIEFWSSGIEFVPVEMRAIFAPYVKVVPGAETAKKVIEAVREHLEVGVYSIGNDRRYISAAALSIISAEFGVQP